MRTKLLIAAITTFYVCSATKAQNWQYVGSPFINQATTSGINFADMEINSSGDIYVGYTSGTAASDLKLAKYSGGTWTQLTAPTNAVTVNGVDIEVHGNDCYMAFASIRSSNMYVFVKKYNGTSWDKVGDSLLLGNSGSGGYFDFLLDNNGVPTLLGVVSSPLLLNKQVMQYISGAWSNIITISGSAPTVFQENAGVFDAQNKLYFVSQGYVTSPTFSYFVVVSKLDGVNRTTVGDTISLFAGGIKIKMGPNNIPYLCFNATSLSRVMAYKLNTTKWSLIADTTSNIGNMYSTDVSADGKIVFYTLASGTTKKIYYYDSGVRKAMDSLNISGFGLGGVSDVVVPAGTNDVYALVLEIKSSATPDLSVMKHTINGSSSAIKNVSTFNDEIVIYPNPATDQIRIDVVSNETVDISVFDISGKLILEKEITQNKNLVDVSYLNKGIYFIQAKADNRISTKKLLIQ